MRCIRGVFRFILSIGLIGMVVWCYARFVEPRMLKTTVHSVEVPKTVAQCKIVFFADTHFGVLYDSKQIDRIVDRINDEQPDIVIFGGDFFDHYARDRAVLDEIKLGDALAEIEAQYGKYSVYGNHDYGGGAVHTYRNVMEHGGFQLLKNTSVFIESLNINVVGFDDYLLGSTDASLYDLKKNVYQVVVTHEPDVADFISVVGEGIILAGHSHGGQVRLPYITEKVLPTGAKKYVKGMYQNTGKERDLPLYVTVGLGVTGYPYRFLNVPEIMVLNLQPK